MKAQKSYRVKAFLAPGDVVVQISTTTTTFETVTKIPISTVMSIVLDGDHFKITAEQGDNSKIGEQQRLDMIRTQQEEWDWNVTPERTGFAPLNDAEKLHLFFHIWFFKDSQDTIGVEVTPPRERDLAVEINAGHSLKQSVTNAWNIAGVVGFGLIANGIRVGVKRRRKGKTKKIKGKHARTRTSGRNARGPTDRDARVG